MDIRKPEAIFGREAVFDTYTDARREANRRGPDDAANGMVTKVVSSPYGGFVVRSWPVELFVEPETRDIVVGKKSVYAGL